MTPHTNLDELRTFRRYIATSDPVLFPNSDGALLDDAIEEIEKLREHNQQIEGLLFRAEALMRWYHLGEGPDNRHSYEQAVVDLMPQIALALSRPGFDA